MRPSLQVLGTELTARILAEAREVLCGVGLTVRHAEARALLADGGARVQDGRVCYTPALIDRALSTAPASFTLHDARGRATHDLGGQRVHFAPASSALTVLDPVSRELRAPTTADYVRYVRVNEALPALAAQSTAFVPADVPQDLADAYRLYLSLCHGTKPVITGAFDADSVGRMRRLLLCVRGSDRALRAQPLAVFTCCPTTPLAWGEAPCANLLDCARAGIPVEVVSMALAGFTAPATLTGTLVQHAAEVIGGVVLHQLAAPGAPVLFGTASTIFDIRYETTPSAAVESGLLSCAVAELGRALSLPTQAYIALSDAKALDAQAGLETGFGAALAAMAGINSVAGPGMLAFINAFSVEKLVLDHEACVMALRLAEGVTPREDFPASPLMLELLAEGHLLIAKHTRASRALEHRLPGPVIDRTGRQLWEDEGRKDLHARLAEEVAQLEERGREAAAPDAVRQALDAEMTALLAASGARIPEAAR